MVENAHKYDAAATKLKFRVTANQMVQEKIKGMEQLARAATKRLLAQAGGSLAVKSTIRNDHNGATLNVTMGFGHARSRLPVPEIDVRPVAPPADGAASWPTRTWRRRPAGSSTSTCRSRADSRTTPAAWPLVAAGARAARQCGRKRWITS